MGNRELWYFRQLVAQGYFEDVMRTGHKITIGYDPNQDVIYYEDSETDEYREFKIKD